jgi:uncharacterized protein YyaL (SSP411 family)
MVLLGGCLLTAAGLKAGTADATELRYNAIQATDDLIRNFWTGSPETGWWIPTWGGRSRNLPNPRGMLWERAMAYGALIHAWKTTSDAGLTRRLQSDWLHTKTIFSAAELESCGAPSGINPAADDAGWSARMYLDAYRVTGDPYALERAKGLVRAAFARWEDPHRDGGLWYSDERRVKSLYQVALTETALRIHETTHEREFLNSALRSYRWMESHLLRPDGLYWVEWGTNGPVGKSHPNHITEAGSVVFLGGNMGMAALHGALHRLTGKELYRLRVLRTADAIRSHLVTSDGIYLNDRDAWTEGAFVQRWVEEVLSLRGISPVHADLLRATGRSIFQNARTSDGHYGGTWNGPAEGPGSRWYVRGSQPDQITTSASSIQMILGAASAVGNRTGR